MSRPRTRLTAAGLAAGTLAAVGTGAVLAGGPALAAPAAGPVGTVYTASNAAAGNRVLVFHRWANGRLSAAGSVATGGRGNGTGVDSQGSLVLSPDGRNLFVVDAGSNQVSELGIGRDGRPWLRGVVGSRGVGPVSVAVAGDRVVVLDAGGSRPSVASYLAGPHGLRPVGAVRILSGTASTDIVFAPGGHRVIVADKGSNTLETLAVSATGRLGPAVSSPADSPAPFAVAVASSGLVLVADAANSAVSTYRLGSGGRLTPTHPPVPDSGAAACWIALGRDGEAFVANAASGDIGSYRVLPGGHLAFFGNTGLPASGAKPLDEAVTPAGTELFVLDAATHAIDAFRVGVDGALGAVPGPAAVPAGGAGLASR